MQRPHPRTWALCRASRASRARERRSEQTRAVVAQLANRFGDVLMRQMRALLLEALRDRGSPPARQLLQRADVQVAVVEEALQLRHVAGQESPILTDAVAAHG